MNRFVAPAAASVVVGLLLGAAAIFGITLMVQQDTKPPLPECDPQSSVLNRVEYGTRGYPAQSGDFSTGLMLDGGAALAALVVVGRCDRVRVDVRAIPGAD